MSKDKRRDQNFFVNAECVHRATARSWLKAMCTKPESFEWVAMRYLWPDGWGTFTVRLEVRRKEYLRMKRCCQDPDGAVVEYVYVTARDIQESRDWSAKVKRMLRGPRPGGGAAKDRKHASKPMV